LAFQLASREPHYTAYENFDKVEALDKFAAARGEIIIRLAMS